MRSEAYGDYCERLREALDLIRVGREARRPRLAAAASKGAVVLAAASLERYLNDALLSLCRLLAAESWEELGPGLRAYMTQQVARRLYRVCAPIVEAKSVDEGQMRRIMKAVQECQSGFERPADWDHLPQFGLLTSGDAAPERIGATLFRFSAEGRDFLQELDKAHVGKDVFLRNLSELIDARHGAAHALPDRSDPSPLDAQAWVVSSFWLVRRIDAFLVFEIERNASRAHDAA